MGTDRLEKRNKPQPRRPWANEFIFLDLFLPLPALSFLWLKCLQDCLLSQGHTFLMAFFGPLQVDFSLSDLISHYDSWAHTLHSLPVSQRSSPGSPCGVPLQRQPSFISMIFLLFIPVSFNYIISFLISVYLLPFNYIKDTVKLNSLKGNYGSGDAIQILSQAHHKFVNPKEGLWLLPKEKKVK